MILPLGDGKFITVTIGSKTDKTVTCCVEVSEPYIFVAVKLTVYVPGFGYVLLLISIAVLVVPSPKSQAYVIEASG